MSHDRLNHLNGALMALSLGLLGFDLGEFGLQDDGPSVGVESFFVLPIAGVGEFAVVIGGVGSLSRGPDIGGNGLAICALVQQAVACGTRRC